MKPITDSSIAVYDIETPLIGTDGINVIDTIYCLSVTIINNNKITDTKIFTEYWTPYSDGTITDGIRLINTADYRSAHNGIGFDDIVVHNYRPFHLLPFQLDTLILAKLMFTADELTEIDAQIGVEKSLWGKFSLKAFGQRLGDHKIEFTDFSSGLTEEMAIYCKQDTDLTARLLLHLLSLEMFPEFSVIKLENKTAEIIAQQVINGFHFNIAKAKQINAELLAEKNKIAVELSKSFKPKFLKKDKESKYKGITTSRVFLPNTSYKSYI